MDSLKAAVLGSCLVGCVLDWNGFFYDEDNSLDEQLQDELLDEKTEIDISWCVSEILNAKYDLIHKMFIEFKSHENWKDPSYFGSCILQAAPTFFPDGYSPESFLAFCSVVCGVIVFYFYEEVNCPAFANVAANVIGLVLIGHVITGEFFVKGSWQRLCAVANSVLITKQKETGATE